MPTFDLSRDYQKIEVQIATDRVVRDALAKTSAEFHRRNGLLESSLVDRYVQTFLAADNHLTKKDIGSEHVRRIHSVRKAAVSLENAVYQQEMHLREHPARYVTGDLFPDSHTAFLFAQLHSVQELTRRIRPESERELFVGYFQGVRSRCDKELQRYGATGLLEGIDFRLKTKDFESDFSERPLLVPAKDQPGKKQPVSVGLDDDELPELPIRSITYSDASIDRVVGNREALTHMLTSVYQLMDFVPKRGNPHGDGLKDMLLLHGMQGTGKNYTVDAVMNHALEYAGRIGKDIKIVDIEMATLSKMKDESTKRLKQYAKLEVESDSLYVNILNEADGSFGRDTSQQGLRKQFVAALKDVTDYTRRKNVLWFLISNNPEDFEFAFGARLRPLDVRGAETPEDFGVLMRNKMQDVVPASDYMVLPSTTQAQEYRADIERKAPPVVSLPKSDWDKVGSVLYDLREELQARHGIYFSGHHVEKIAAESLFDMREYLRHAKQIHQLPSFELKKKAIQLIRPQLCVEDISSVARSYAESLVNKRRSARDYSSQGVPS